jgi:hypothetical protein
MTHSEGHAAARWGAGGVVVAAYAGARAGLGAFTEACLALRRALPGSRISVLCPANLRIDVVHGVDGVIEYSSPDAERASDQAAVEATLRAVQRLAARGAHAALVFAERGIAPYAPAYLCYLAGIAYRAGFEAEFGGAVLSPSFSLPEISDDADRHLALLAAVGLESSRRSSITAAAARLLPGRSEVAPAGRLAEANLASAHRSRACDR